MNVTVRLFAVLRERAGRSEIELTDLPDAMDVAALKRELERRVPALGKLDRVAGVVGTSYVRDAHAVRDGDEVSFLPPVSGGSTQPARDAGRAHGDSTRDDEGEEPLRDGGPSAGDERRNGEARDSGLHGGEAHDDDARTR